MLCFRWCVVLLVTLTASMTVGVGAQQQVDAEQMRQWSARQWAAEALRQADAVDDPADADSIRLERLMALCQLPDPPEGLAEEAEAIAQRVVQRLKEARQGGHAGAAAKIEAPAEADVEDGMLESDDLFDLNTAGYVLARLGEFPRAQRWAELIAEPDLRADYWVQVGWGVAERQEADRVAQVNAEIESAVSELESWEQAWWQSDIGAFWLLLGDVGRAHAAAQLMPGDEKFYSLLSLVDLAMDTQQAAAIDLWLPQLRALHGFMAGDVYADAEMARLDARRGEIEDAERLLDRVSKEADLYTYTALAVAVAEAQHDAGRDADGEATLRKLAEAIAQADGIARAGDPAPDPAGDALTQGELAYLWGDLAVACHETGRFDLLADAWQRCDSPRHRGRMATGVATHLAWQHYVRFWKPLAPAPI